MSSPNERAAMKLLHVVGARPQFIKVAPVVAEVARREAIEDVLVHTGQHYDVTLSEAIFRDLDLREPDVDLEIGSGSHGVQTGRMLAALEGLLLDDRPDALLVYGDTNSTLAGALAAAKLHIPTAHVEAGLRSGNRRMPEELNRIVADHVCDLLLAPTDVAMANLAAEGLGHRAVQTGDVMVDALERIADSFDTVPAWAIEPFFVATIHRAENTDDPERVAAVLGALASLPHPVHLLIHPRLRVRLAEQRLEHLLDAGSVGVHDPLPYSTMLATLRRARGLVTDSGGLQKEAFILKVPCTTIRAETEWPETLAGGWNVLAGDRLDELADLVVREPTEVEGGAPFGTGRAATAIVDAVATLVAGE